MSLDFLSEDYNAVTGIAPVPEFSGDDEKKKKKRPPKDITPILERMRGGTSGQESGGKTKAVNPDSGALGEFQVMPANVPEWTRRYYRKQLKPEEFKNNPEAQRAVFDGEMGKYLQKALRRAKGDEDLAVRMAAAAWYGGEKNMRLYDDPKPQYYNGRKYPSFREYTSKILKRTKGQFKGNAFDLNTLSEDFQNVVGELPANNSALTSDYADVTGDLSALGDDFAQVTRQTADKPLAGTIDDLVNDKKPFIEPTNPVNIAPEPKAEILQPPPVVPPAVNPVVPEIETLGGLEGTENAFPPQTETPVQTISDYENVQPEPVEAEYQKYLKYTQKTDTPEERKTFEQLAQSDFGKDVSVSAQMNAPLEQQSDIQQPVLQQPEQPAAVEVPKPETKTKVVKTDADILETIAGSVEVDMSKKPAGMPLQDYLFRAAMNEIGKKYNLTEAQRQTAEKVIRADAGKLLVNDYTDVTDENFNEFLDEYKSAYGKSSMTINLTRNAINAALTNRSGGEISDTVRKDFEREQAERNIALNTSEQSLGKDEFGNEIKPRDYTAEYDRQDAERELLSSGDNRLFRRLEEQISAEKSRDPFSDGKPPTYEEVLDRLKLYKEVEPDAEELGKIPVIGSLTAGFMGGAGRLYQSLAGLQRLNPLNSLFNDAPYKLLKRIGDKSALLGELTNKDGGFGTTLLKTIGGAPVDVSRLIALSRLPGGVVVGFAVDSGLQSAGRGENVNQIVKEAIKGGTLGALFKVSGTVASKVNSELLKPVARIGTITGGTFVIEKTFGASNEEALQSAILNGIFDVVQVYGADAFGKVYRVWQKGKPTDVKVEPDGQVLLLDGKVENRPVDVEMVLDATDGVYKMKSEVGRETPVKETVPAETKLLKGQDAEVKTDIAAVPKALPSAPKPAPETITAKLTDSNVADVFRELTDAGYSPSEAGNLIEKAKISKPTTPEIQKTDVSTPKAESDVSQKVETPETLRESKRETTPEVEARQNWLQSKADKPLDVGDTILANGLTGGKITKKLGIEKGEQIFEVERATGGKIVYGETELQQAFQDGTAFSTAKAVRSEINEQAQNINQPAQLRETDVDKKPAKTNTAESAPIETIEQKYSELPEQKKQEVAPEKPKAQVVYKEPENIAKKLDVFTERGTKTSIEPKVISTDDILTSLDEGYPPEFQPRDRSRTASKAQISDIANKLNPEFLGDSPKAGDGRPLVVPVEIDGKTKYAVISGNGRTEAIRAAYNLGNEPSKKYAEFANAKGDGKVKQPVYVGVLNPNEVDLKSFAKEANESATAQMSATEQAKSDAEQLTPEILNQFIPSDDGTIHGAANRDFVKAFFAKVVPASEQGRLVDADGRLNQDGVNRVRNAIFASAFGESEKGLNAIARMSESTDNNVKNITNGLLSKAGQIASLKQAVKDGTRHKEFDISSDLATAMEKYVSLKESGTSVDEYIQQGNLFGAETTPFQTRVIQVFDKHKRSPKAVRSIIGNFLNLADEAGNPNQQNLFGENAKIDVKSAFEASVESYEQGIETDRTEQAGLFGSNQGLQIQPVAEKAVSADAQTPRNAPESKPKLTAPERAELRRKKDVTESELKEAGVEPLGEKGESGQTSYKIRRAMFAADSTLLPDLAKTFDVETSDDIQNSGNAVLDAISEIAGKSRSSQMTQDDWNSILDTFADKMPIEAVKSIEDALSHQEAFNKKITEFATGEKMAKILESADLSVKEFKYLPLKTRKEILKLGREYGISDDQIKRAFNKTLSDFAQEESLGQGTDRKSAETATQSESKSQAESAEVDEIQFSLTNGKTTSPDFYSAVERAIENNPQNKFSAEQVKALLNKTPGIKQEEIDWLGLPEFLETKDKFTKDELLDFVRENQVEIEEVVKGKVDLEGISQDLWGRPFNELSQGQANAVRMQLDVGYEPKSGTKFSQYTLPNGENYRELLLTMPPKPMSFETYKKQGFNQGLSEQEMRDEYDRIPKNELINERGEPYKSSHWDEPNVLAHIRFDERTDSQGRRTLHIAEIQSDWAQAARKTRMAEINRIAKEKGIEPKEAAKLVPDDFGYATQGKYKFTVIEDGDLFAVEMLNTVTGRKTVDKGFGTRQAAETVARNRQNNFSNPSDVPNQPFKKSWQELAFKKALRFAVENNFDAVSWDTGEVQADRYDLSKQVDSIDVYAQPNGQFNFRAIKDGKTQIEEKNISDAKLEEYLGKDLTEKILNDAKLARRIAKEEKEDIQVKEYSGIDLKVGGEGMKGFYDKILPSFVNKYVKKWGSKVESGDVVTTPSENKDYELREEDGRFVVYDTISNEFENENVGDFATRAEAVKFLEDNYLPIKAVHTVAITPEMKESVMQGQPLFDKTFQNQGKKLDKRITRNLKRPLESVLSRAEISFNKADDSLDFNEAGGAFLSNVFKQAGYKSVSFAGAYLNPRQTRKVRTALSDVRKSKPEFANKLDTIIKSFDKASSGAGDVVLAVSEASAPMVRKYSIQEEKAHRAIKRSGIREKLVQLDVSVDKKFENIIDESYNEYTETGKRDELWAKHFRDDAESVFDATAEEIDTNLDNFFTALAENDIDLESFAKEIETVSERGKRFADYAKNKRPSDDGKDVADRTRTSDSFAKDSRSIRERRNRQSATDVDGRDDKFRKLRQTKFAESDSGETRSLVKAKQTDLTKSDDEIQFATTPKRNLFSYIWEGRGEDATPKKEVIVNFRRAGLLTGFRTHLRNILSNAANQAAEESIRPIAMLADIAASTQTGIRTVQPPSVSAIGKSFASLVYADKTMKALNKESAVSRAWNILKNGDIKELEKNQLTEMQSGSPIVDAIVNYTFRALGAEDALFKVYAMRRSLEEQAKTLAITESKQGAAKNLNFTDRRKWRKNRQQQLLDNPTNAMLLEAEIFADFTTFTNDNPFSDWFKRVKDLSPTGKAVTEIIVPYDRTPTNIIARTLEFTPLGLGWAAKHLVDLKKGDSYALRKMRSKFEEHWAQMDKGRKGVKGLLNARTIKLLDGSNKIQDEIDRILKNVLTEKQQEHLSNLEKERSELLNADRSVVQSRRLMEVERMIEQYTKPKERDFKQQKRLNELYAQLDALKKKADSYQKIRARRELKDKWSKQDRALIEKALKEIFPRHQQQAFARSVGRAGLGTSLLALGIYLAMRGLLSGIWDAGDREERNEFYDRRDKGILNGSLVLGGRRYQIADTPAGKVMVLGASIYERSQQKRKKGETKPDKTLSGIKDVGSNLVLEQPLLNSLDDYFGSNKPFEKRVGGLLGSFVPTIFADIADVKDEDARENEDLQDATMNRIPLLREQNKKSKYTREPYLRNRVNRIIDKIDPTKSRPSVTADTRVELSIEDFERQKQDGKAKPEILKKRAAIRLKVIEKQFADGKVSEETLRKAKAAYAN